MPKIRTRINASPDSYGPMVVLRSERRLARILARDLSTKGNIIPAWEDGLIDVDYVEDGAARSILVTGFSVGGDRAWVLRYVLPPVNFETMTTEPMSRSDRILRRDDLELHAYLIGRDTELIRKKAYNLARLAGNAHSFTYGDAVQEGTLVARDD
jgi:hypothetical protein